MLISKVVLLTSISFTIFLDVSSLTFSFFTNSDVTIKDETSKLKNVKPMEVKLRSKMSH